VVIRAPVGSEEPTVVKAGCVAGFLDVHSEVDDVGEHLHVALRLHVAAHHAEAEPGFPIARVTKAGMIVWKGRLPCGA
jgi:hypothetical protein